MQAIRLRAALAAGLTLSGVIVAQARAWDNSPLTGPVVRHSYHCGAHDRPEPGLQGQVPKADQRDGDAKKGYNCGLELVGFTPLAKTVDRHDSRPNDNANLSWAGSCAYVSGAQAQLFHSPLGKAPTRGKRGGPGIAVVDVHNPAHPRMVRILRMPGAVATSETINAITKPDGTAILVVGEYGNDPVSYRKPMDIYTYNTHDPNCAHLRHIPNPTHPKSLATYYWPTNIHNLTVTPDGNYVYATIPIQAIDLRRFWQHARSPKAASYITYVGNLDKAIGGAPDGVGPLTDLVPENFQPIHPFIATENSHEAYATDDKTVYIGGQTPIGDLFTIINVRNWLASDGKQRAQVIGQYAGRGHSIRGATINGHHYLLHSEESVFGGAYGCVPQVANPIAGAAQPFLTNIDDPTHPRTVSEMGLEINQPENCLTQIKDGENDSVHYHDVDSATDTHFVMASMWNAGIRVFDVRNPALPTEVAYFNSADVAGKGQPTLLDQDWGHIHYIPQLGELWFASEHGGFYVLRLEDQVRHQLALPPVSSSAPRSHLVDGVDAGWPGTTGLHYLRYTLADIATTSQFYCTIAPYTQQPAVH
ncbi:MAG TPA: hypothetical protein VHD81_03615 [Mycobacteriales bacterium]|nr:hypothetical protein [Mycobacteriales bacterium]